ncbi:tyrosine--tRNA ligase [Patescibacteria group bacterium]
MDKNEKIKHLLYRRADEVIIKKHLRKRLSSGEKLRIKFGIDPTANVLHLGHSVPLLKLREFQKMGHQVILLIGDFTARIGDPTGRTASRIPLTMEKIGENMKTYQKQASLILDMKKVEVRHNSEWFGKMDFKGIMTLASKVTYSQVSARADFKKRLAEDKDFTLEEFLYPVLQGYDSVALKADVEIGGTDQKFNMLMGRRIQKQYKQELQDIVTCPLLEGTDGKEKMSKSMGNYIALTEEPAQIYGKIMSIPDSLIKKYFELLTEFDEKQIKKSLDLGPRDAKAELAKEIVCFYYNKDKAEKAEQEFNKIFREKKEPTDMPVVKIKEAKIILVDLIIETKLISSKSEAKRLIEQGGVKIDNEIEKNWQEEITIKDNMIIQIGKRRFVRVRK